MLSARYASLRVLLGALTLATAGCSTATFMTVKRAGEPDLVLRGLSACNAGTHESFDLDPTRPLIVLVHGCNFSMGGFRNLAEVFEANGQQTVCFSYDDRSTIEASSRQLVNVLEALEAFAPGQQITVLGHSQGGLVARHSFSADRDRSFAKTFRYRLVTLSAPFSGINSSRQCGLPWLRVASLGVTALICQLIAGDKWTEIYPGSAFMTEPGTLSSGVSVHLRIATDERGRCARRGRDGACVKRDETFSLAEQLSTPIDSDARVEKVEIQAGHTEIVGEWGKPPLKLIAVLQQMNILAQTLPWRRDRVNAVLERLYGVPSDAEAADSASQATLVTPPGEVQLRSRAHRECVPNEGCDRNE